MSSNGNANHSPEETPLYTIKWPRAESHVTKSASGILVESNVRGQIALHVYNEVRELEAKVDYNNDGARTTAARGVTYVREITDSILVSDESARQLRDVLDELLKSKQNS